MIRKLFLQACLFLMILGISSSLVAAEFHQLRMNAYRNDKDVVPQSGTANRTRVVFEFSDYVVHSLNEETGALTLIFNDCSLEQGILKQWNDGLITSVQIKAQGKNVKATIQTSHKYSTYKKMVLEGPYRVVLDIVSDTYNVYDEVETEPTADASFEVADTEMPLDEEGDHFDQELKLYREASQFYNEEKYAEAIVGFETIIKDYPNGVFEQSAKNLLNKAKAQINSNVSEDSSEQAATEKPSLPIPKSSVQVQSYGQSSSPLDQKISINLQNAPIIDVLTLLSEKGHFNIIADQSVQGTVSINLEDKTILDVLELILHISGYGYERINDVVIVGSKESLDHRRPMVTRVFEVKYSDPKSLKAILDGIVGENATIQVDEEARKIVVTATHNELRRIEQIIEEVDQQPYQVMLEAKVVEVSTDALSRFGFEFASPINFNMTERGESASNGLLDFQAIRRDPVQINATLDALISNGKAKSLANSKISTINNRKATILIGDRVPYTTTDKEGEQDVEFIESGISLEIVPHINSDNYITTEIKPVVSYIYGWKGPNSEIPWLKTREASATVRVRDGETIVLGGLLNEQEKESLTRVPILGDIPLLGNLFTKKVKDNVSSDLIIIVSPHIAIPQIEQEVRDDFGN